MSVVQVNEFAPGQRNQKPLEGEEFIKLNVAGSKCSLFIGIYY